MKKFLSLLGVLTVLVGVVNANVDKPKSPAGMAVVKSVSGFKLFYQGEKRGDVKVTIYNASGQVVHKETLRNIESFVRPYNLTSLSDGDYTVELIGEDGRQVKTVSYSVAKNGKHMKLIRLAGTENKYFLAVANTGTDALRIKIYNESNTLIFNELEKIDGNFGKIYRLENVGKDFRFEITDRQGITKTLSR